MQTGSVHLQTARKIVEVLKARIAIAGPSSRKSRVLSTRKAAIPRITALLVVGLDLSVLTIIASLGALVALIFLSLHLFATSTAIELFHECAIGVLLSELISTRRRHRSRK
jgi:hypothetical protein